MDVKFGTWSLRSLCRTGSLKTVVRELGRYKLDLVGVQEVRWEKEGTERAEDYTFFYGEGIEDYQLGSGFFAHKRIVSAFRRVEFINDRLTYIILKGHRCYIIVLNVHATCEVRSGDLNNSFYEELGYIFYQFPMYNMKILLGDFIAEVDREDISKPTIRNENSREISNDNGIRVIKFTHLKT
jgi:exonuclease III